MFKLKKKNTPLKFSQFFQNIPPTFPPKFPNFPNGLNGPKVLVAKKNPQRLLGLRTRRRTNAHPEEYRWTLTTSPGPKDPAVDPWHGKDVCYVNPHHFLVHISQNMMGILLQKGGYTFFQTRIFWKIIPWVSIEVWQKKNAASGPQMHQNVVLEPLRKTLLPLKHQWSCESKGHRPSMPPFPTQEISYL